MASFGGCHSAATPGASTKCGPKTFFWPLRPPLQSQKLGEWQRYKEGLVLDPIDFSVDLAVAHGLSRGRRRWDRTKSRVATGRSL